MTDINKIAIESGAELAPAYEYNGNTVTATYTVTMAQLEAIIGKMAARLLTALDGMDRGCTEAGFRGHQNGLGEEAGNELQDAREELAALVGHVPAVEVETD